MDPIEKLGDEHLRALATDLMVQLEKGTALRPVLWMLAQARKRAAKAVAMFIDLDINDVVDVPALRKLQMEICIYDDMVRNARELLARGREADQRIGEDDRLAIEEIVAEMSPEDRRLYQLTQQGAD
jgi:hypothetical protein